MQWEHYNDSGQKGVSMNDIFNFFSPLSFVKSGIVSYNPLINYDWSTTTASGLRYLKDVGSTPIYNASMYFGRGAYLNGVDQTITVPINTTIQTALKRVNGIVTINETSQTLTNYVISGLGVHKDYYLFTRLLTTAEKDSYTNTPELFYAMAQADSTCVLNMPMCETDSYARNMKSYSLGSELASNDYTKYSSYYGAVISSYNNKIKVANTTYSYGQAQYALSTTIGNTYVLKVFFELGTSYYGKAVIGSSGKEVIKTIQSSGEYSLVFVATSTSSYIVFEASQNTSNYILVSSITCTQQSGIHPITNYTTSVRDNAKNLQYGLQTCKFVRDSLGVIQSASNYLECNGTGYAIIPSHADTVNIKMTVNPTSLSGNLLSGGVTKTLTGLTLNVDNDVVISNVTPTGAITLASGFSGTIKTYTEELS